MNVGPLKYFSRKLWMTIFALLVLCSIYWWQVDYLFAFIKMIPTFVGDPATIQAQLVTLQAVVTAYSGLTRDVMVAVTAALGAYLGVSGLVQWKHGTGAMVEQIAETISESRSEVIDERRRIEVDEGRARDENYTEG